MFGLIRCRIRPPNDLHFPILPEQDQETGKVLFHLNVMQGTWVSFEMHYAVSRGYIIEETLNSITSHINQTQFLLSTTKPSLILRGKQKSKVIKVLKL